MFKSKATREGNEVEARFKAQAEKAYERYKIAKEIEDTEKMKRIVAESAQQVEHYSDAKGMYIIEREKEIPTGLGGESSHSLHFVGGIKENFSKSLKGFFRNMYTDSNFELKWQEFMYITFFLQLPIYYMIRHITMIRRWGALLVLIVYVIIGAFIAMPVYMLLMFMGNYGRKSYVRYWECVPILKGVAYSVIIMTLVQEIANVTFLTIFVDYLVDTLTAKTSPWANCNFQHRSKDCVAEPIKGGYNETCCLASKEDCNQDRWGNKVFRYAAIDYFKFERKRQHLDGYTPNNQRAGLQMMLITVALWLIILIALLIGLKKMRYVLTVLNLTLLLLIFMPFFVLTVYMNDYGMFEKLDSHFGDLFDYRFWLQVGTYSLHRELAGDVLTFSAMSSPGITTTVDTVCIYTVKFMYLLLLTVWTSMALTIVQNFYNVMDSSCLFVDGFTVMYGIFPELLSHNSFTKPCLLAYFTVIIYWCLSVSIYTLNSFIGAIFEEFPRLVKFKVVVCTFVCIGCCVANLFIIKMDIEDLYANMYTKDYIEMKMIVVFFTLLGIYLYSLRRLSDDYHFTYGQKLNLFWIHGVKVAMMLIVSIVVLRVFIKYDELASEQALVPAIMILPIVVGAIVAFIRYKTGKRSTIISPDPQWGPPSLSRRRARRRFDPKRDLRYMSTIQKCRHSCLLQSTGLSREIKYWRNKRFSQYAIKME